MPSSPIPISPLPASAGLGRHVAADVSENSRWFTVIKFGTIAPGEEIELDASDEEVWCWPTEGEADLVLPSGEIDHLVRFDGVFLPRGNRVTLRNTGAVDLTWIELPAGARDTEHETTIRNIAPVVFHRRLIGPRHWPAATNMGASPKNYWFYEVDSISDWFHTACIGVLAPGGTTALHTHLESVEGPYEGWYLILRGDSGLLRSEFGDYPLEHGPSGGFITLGASHQLVNNSEDFMFYLTISSRGTSPLKLDIYELPPGPRPGYEDEYRRIIAARTQRGLNVP